MRIGVWIAGMMIGLSTTVWAGEAGWTEPSFITALEANQQARFILRLDFKKSVSGCRNADGFYADYGRPGSELMYQTALEAMRYERKVQVYVTGVCNFDGDSAISSVRILP